MFIGRERELEILLDSLRPNRSAALIYGKRRVGKTTLIKRALENQKKPYIYYECLKGSMRENIDGFTRELLRLKLLPFTTEFPTMQDVFAYLNTLATPLIVVIDEYPYLKTATPGPAVDSAFQSVIDNNLTNICLVLSGSHIGMMRELLEEGNALYGRFGCVIRLKELSYRQAAAFYPDLSAYDKAALYGVFGGSPYILEQLRPDLTLRQNIVRTILDESSPVYLYAAHLLLSDYSNSVNAERIMAALGNGKRKYKELEDRLNANRTGNLSKQMKTLVALDILRRTTPINRQDDVKKVRYEISDNLMRFYFAYIYKNQSALKMLGPETFYDQYVEPTLISFLAGRFEEICRDYFSFLAHRRLLNGVMNIGTFYYDDPVEKRNGEFDVALDYGGTYGIFEAKYHKDPMELDEIHREIAQIRDIREIPVTQIGFISINGFAAKEEGCVYYSGTDLYA